MKGVFVLENRFKENSHMFCYFEGKKIKRSNNVFRSTEIVSDFLFISKQNKNLKNIQKYREQMSRVSRPLNIVEMENFLMEMENDIYFFFRNKIKII